MDEPKRRARELAFAVRHLVVQSRIFNMKTILTLVAVAAALAGASVASAHENAGGHWEWQSRPTFGPNKSNLPPQVRVWVNDRNSEMADCNCDMMKMSAADCMRDMPGKRAAPSAG
ncbi:MAG: hypothetical protein ACOY4P_04995 [Pseudomonadota bacterium]